MQSLNFSNNPKDQPERYTQFERLLSGETSQVLIVNNEIQNADFLEWGTPEENVEAFIKKGREFSRPF